ncbi:HD domain-containing protein [Natronincola ferrireducens]|uniref:HD domain-containing protein n=1 Tax=Natronincola ferrireducens TaxID=393762 RepID=A0A1G8Z0R6_9FIRM|nr:HD domain-containing protein [Natronincola ferrireducens]SDK07905.1 HD domain-containing protein [Natronincola ferrireducens]
MFYRGKQFFQGLTAKIHERDLDFIEIYLSPEEKELFSQLRKSEQRHSLNVAYGCQEKVPHDRELIQAALLHDIGKIGSNLTLMNKSFVVLAQALKLPHQVLPSFLKKAMYFKNYHAELGYRLLNNLPLSEKVLFLVRNHHKKNDNSIKEMTILQCYDDKY